jgi:ribosome-binding factor A
MIGSTIRKELMLIIMRELSDPRLTGMPSITKVQVSDDYEYADIFVTIMGTPGQQNAALNALKHSAGMMRTKLTKSLSMRHAPFLRFQIDEGLKKELEVLDLIEKAKREADEAERKRSGLPADSEAPLRKLRRKSKCSDSESLVTSP